MPWARFDDRFPSNRKVRLLSDRAFRLYVSAICWSAENLTDGFVAETELRLVADIRGAKAAASELVDAGLWVPSTRVRAAVVPSSRRVRAANASSSCRGRVEVGDTPGDTKVPGWEIHDYHDYNPTAEQVKAERTAKTARQQRWREKKRSSGPDTTPPRNGPAVDASTDASQDASRDGTGDAAPRARVPDPTRPVDGGAGRERSDRSSARDEPALSLITNNWQPTDADRTAAAADIRRLGTESVHTATAKFVRHHTAKQTRAADYGPLWVSWLARERADPPTQGAFLVGLPGGNTTPPTPTPPPFAQRMAELDARAAADRAREH